MQKKSDLVIDGIGLVGLGMLGFGLFLYHPALAFVVVGGILLYGAVVAAKARNAP